MPVTTGPGRTAPSAGRDQAPDRLRGQSLAARDTSRRCGCRRPGRETRSAPPHARAGRRARAVDRARPAARARARARITLASRAEPARALVGGSIGHRPPRADPGREEASIADRVADAGDDLLIEQRLADLALAAPGVAARAAAAAGSKPVAAAGRGRAAAGPGRSRSSPHSLTSGRVLPPACAATARPDREPAATGSPYGESPSAATRPASAHAQVAVEDEVAAEVQRAGACRAPRRARACGPRARPARR